ncbi:hypothetical protein HDU86_002946 [Geranomyces michiganensis]|nr:hypothetical protein HDU86_002946 [Geranomyces michiganensis]
MTSVVAFAAGKVVSAVSAVNAFYSEVNPSTLSGAIDVVVIKHLDGDLVCSPFHVRFGKLKLLRPHDKAVTVTVNGQQQEDLLMKLGEAGEAFFVVETENPVPSEYATSPIQHAQDTSNVTMDPFDLNAGEDGEHSPTSPNAYHSAHASDIPEDEYPPDSATTPSPAKTSAEHLEPPVESAHISSKSSTKGGTELPIDADDVAHLFEHDARMVGMIQGKHEKSAANVNANAKPAAVPATSGKRGENARSDEHLDVNIASKGDGGSRRGSTAGSAKSAKSDLPKDADDVARAFAHDARLVGMNQSSKEANPMANGIVETTPPTAADGVKAAKDATLAEKVVDKAQDVAEKVEEKAAEAPAADDEKKAEAAKADVVEDVTAQDSVSQVDGATPDSKQAPGVSSEVEENRFAASPVPVSIPQPQEGPLNTPNSVLTDDPMVKTANAVASALGSHVPVVPLHALSASASSPPPSQVAAATNKPEEPDFELQTLLKPEILHSKSFPVSAIVSRQDRRRSSHTRSSSVHAPGDETSASQLDSLNEGSMPGAYHSKRNTGPLSDTEVEYTHHEKAKSKKGWTWGWGGLPKKELQALSGGDGGGGSGERITPSGQQLRDRTKSAEQLKSMTVDEKVNNYLAGLPESQQQPQQRPQRRSESPTPATDEAGTPTAEHPSPPAQDLPPLSVAFHSDVEVELSLVGYEKVMSARPKDADELFNQHIVSFDAFCKNPELLNDTSLVVRIEGNYCMWQMAAPMLVANLAYKKSLPEEMVQKMHHIPRRPGQLATDSRRYSFNPLKTWWSRGSSVPKPLPVEAADKSKVDAEGNPLDGELAREDSAVAGVGSGGEHAAGATDAKSDVASQKKAFPTHFAKSLRLTSEQLKALNLKPGPNTITFTVNQSGASVSAKLFLYDYTCKIVISDIDGTITKSDALGHIFTMVGKDWTHSGIASLYTNIRKNGYHILYLTSRAIGQAGTTREYLAKVEQGGFQLPEGPVIMSPDRLFASFHREVILRKPEEFKMACLRDIKRLFVDRTPFYAGFGNRITDALSYRSVDVPSSRIFTIDSGGEVKLELLANYKSSYIKLNDIVDQIFPTTSCGDVVTAEWNDWSFWRPQLPDIELPGDAKADHHLAGANGDGRAGGEHSDEDEEYTEDEDEEGSYEDDDYEDLDSEAEIKNPDAASALASVPVPQGPDPLDAGELNPSPQPSRPRVDSREQPRSAHRSLLDDSSSSSSGRSEEESPAAPVGARLPSQRVRIPSPVSVRVSSSSPEGEPLAAARKRTRDKQAGGGDEGALGMSGLRRSGYSNQPAAKRSRTAGRMDSDIRSTSPAQRSASDVEITLSDADAPPPPPRARPRARAHPAAPANDFEILDALPRHPLPAIPPARLEQRPIDLTAESPRVIDLTESPAVVPPLSLTATRSAAEASTPSRPPASAIASGPVFDLTLDDDDDPDIQVVHHRPANRLVIPPSLLRLVPAGQRDHLYDENEVASMRGDSYWQSELNRLMRTVPESLRIRRVPSPPPYAPVQPIPQRNPPPLPPSNSSGAAAVTAAGPPPPTPLEPDPAPLKCAICLESLGEGSQLSTTMCGHIFCAECIRESAKWQKKCPSCRKVLKGKNPFIRLYT